MQILRDYASVAQASEASEGSDVYLFATTLADGRKVLVKCEKY